MRKTEGERCEHLLWGIEQETDTQLNSGTNTTGKVRFEGASEGPPKGLPEGIPVPVDAAA